MCVSVELTLQVIVVNAFVIRPSPPFFVHYICHILDYGCSQKSTRSTTEIRLFCLTLSTQLAWEENNKSMKEIRYNIHNWWYVWPSLKASGPLSHQPPCSPPVLSNFHAEDVNYLLVSISTCTFLKQMFPWDKADPCLTHKPVRANMFSCKIQETPNSDFFCSLLCKRSSWICIEFILLFSVAACWSPSLAVADQHYADDVMLNAAEEKTLTRGSSSFSSHSHDWAMIFQSSICSCQVL